MAEVGIRALRADLSRWIERVREGEEIVVTDRGEPVARIVPVERARALDRLIREGRVTPAARRDGSLPPLLAPLDGDGPTLSEMVIEERRSGW